MSRIVMHGARIAVGNALLFAAKNDDRPMLATVCFKYRDLDGGRLEIVATDSYTLFRYRMGIGEQVKECVMDDGQYVLVDQAWLTEVVRHADGRENVPLELEWDAPPPGPDVRARVGRRSWDIPGVWGEFPRYEQLIPAPGGTDTREVGFNAQLFSRLMKLRDPESGRTYGGGGNDPVLVYELNGPLKPMVCRPQNRSVDMLVLLMPVRIP